MALVYLLPADRTFIEDGFLEIAFLDDQEAANDAVNRAHAACCLLKCRHTFAKDCRCRRLFFTVLGFALEEYWNTCWQAGFIDDPEPYNTLSAHIMKWPLA